VPTQRQSALRGSALRTVQFVRTASGNKGSDRLLDRSVSDRATSELLLIVLGHTCLDRHDLEASARAIDAGGLKAAAERPDELSMNAGYEPEIAAGLMAAFELARRAALPEQPAVVRAPEDVAAIAHRELGGLSRERGIVIVCDAANRHQRTISVSDGAIDRSLIPVRESLTAVLRSDGRAFAIAHNHPCGDPEPSDADIAATRQLAEAARVVGLRFLGHVVISPDRRWSRVI
jgi:DNA repair protein RadC